MCDREQTGLRLAGLRDTGVRGALGLGSEPEVVSRA